MVAKVFWEVAWWFLSGPSQRSPSPSVYDVLVSKYSSIISYIVYVMDFSVEKVQNGASYIPKDKTTL